MEHFDTARRKNKLFKQWMYTQISPLLEEMEVRNTVAQNHNK